MSHGRCPRQMVGSCCSCTMIIYTIQTTNTTITSFSQFSAITNAHLLKSPIQSSSLNRDILFLSIASKILNREADYISPGCGPRRMQQIFTHKHSEEAWNVHESLWHMLNITDYEICTHSELLCKRRGVPYQATNCTLSLHTSANWTKFFIRHQRFHFIHI